MAITLTVLSNTKELIKLTGIPPIIVNVNSELRPAVERWLKYGISEWLGHGIDAYERITTPDNPEFLIRLCKYIYQQSHLNCIVEYKDELEILDVDLSFWEEADRVSAEHRKRLELAREEERIAVRYERK